MINFKDITNILPSDTGILTQRKLEIFSQSIAQRLNIEAATTMTNV